MNVQPVLTALAVLQSLLMLVGLGAGIRHAEQSRWAVVIATAFGGQALAMAWAFAPLVAPSLFDISGLAFMIQGNAVFYWMMTASMLAILIATIALVRRLPRRSAGIWALVAAGGVTLHLVLEAGHRIATRFRWHANKFGRLSDSLTPLVASGHAAAQVAVVLGVFGVFTILRRTLAFVPQGAQAETTSDKGLA